MPAAAVIPAPLAYINVVAVKKLVVGFLTYWTWPGVLKCDIVRRWFYLIRRVIWRVVSCLGLVRLRVEPALDLADCSSLGELSGGHPLRKPFCLSLGWYGALNRLL